MRRPTPRPTIRYWVKFDMDQQVVDQATQRAQRLGLSLSEYVEQLLSAEVSRFEVERMVLRPQPEPILTVQWTWARRRVHHLLDLVHRLGRPVVVAGCPSPGLLAREIRGRDPRASRRLGIHDRAVMLPVRRRLRLNLQERLRRRAR